MVFFAPFAAFFANFAVEALSGHERGTRASRRARMVHSQ